MPTEKTIVVYKDHETAPVFNRVMTARLDTDFELPEELWKAWLEARKQLIEIEEVIAAISDGFTEPMSPEEVLAMSGKVDTRISLEDAIAMSGGFGDD